MVSSWTNYWMSTPQIWIRWLYRQTLELVILCLRVSARWACSFFSCWEGRETKASACPVSSSFGVTNILKQKSLGCLGGSVGWVSHFGSGHDLTVRGFEPHIGLCADSSEPGACFWFSVSFSLSAPPPFVHMLSLSFPLSLSKIDFKKNNNKKILVIFFHAMQTSS